MSLNRYAKQRDTNEPEVIKALEHVGALVRQLDTPLDLLVGYGRQWFLIEVKMPGGKLTPNQEEFFDDWSTHAACGVAAVVRNASEALAVIGCETRGVEVGPRVMTSPWLDGTGS